MNYFRGTGKNGASDDFRSRSRHAKDFSALLNDVMCVGSNHGVGSGMWLAVS